MKNFLMKKYWYTKNHVITWCLLLNEVQQALSPKQESTTNFLLAWLFIKNRKIIVLASFNGEFCKVWPVEGLV